MSGAEAASGADRDRMERPVTSREREDRGGAAHDLEALRIDVVVRNGVAEPVQGEAEDERAGARADERAACCAGCDVQGDDHATSSDRVARAARRRSAVTRTASVRSASTR